jgi:branched-subunit amino acid aminotransferase/4-amino-4-deoxychorismate lyase
MSGGGPGFGSRIWMRADPIVEPHTRAFTDPITIGLSWPVAPGDELARHKTLNYWAKRRAHERAVRDGWGEVLGVCPSGLAWEGSRTSLFVVADGTLIVPPDDGPFLPGIMRGVVLERAAALGIASRREPIAVDAPRHADEVFLTSGVRGIIPVERLEDRVYEAPGPITRRLADETTRWLMKK